MTRYAFRVDANQSAVVSALEAAGATVQIVGKPLDLLVGIRGQFILIEVKDGAKVKSAQKPTKAQEKFFERFPGYPWAIVDGPEAALRAIGCLK